MQFGLSAPKRNADGGYMCSVREGTERMFGRTAGKVLVLAQGEAFSRIAFASRTSRALTVLWEGDALALFSLPEVGCVLASGGQDVLCAARFFAAVRRVPCALFPTQATLDGVFERRRTSRLPKGSSSAMKNCCARRWRRDMRGCCSPASRCWRRA